jgi:hypothetical protein
LFYRGSVLANLLPIEVVTKTGSLSIALSGIGTWRDFDSLFLCLVLNALALVLNVLAENLDALKCGGWGYL